MKVSQLTRSLLHLFFPHCCPGCGNDVPGHEQLLCLSCISRLPVTNFHLHTGNPVENIFRGRLPLVSATSYCYFTKDSQMQHLLHQFKYKDHQEIGHWFGRRIGESLLASAHSTLPDALIPIPLFAGRERRRGYNQASIVCEGIAEVTGIPIWNNIVVRTSPTETQTRKNRIERWQNIEGRFALQHPAIIRDKHLLLVDDVVTTGATLEACGRTLLAAGNVQLSIATLAFTTH